MRHVWTYVNAVGRRVQKHLATPISLSVLGAHAHERAPTNSWLFDRSFSPYEFYIRVKETYIAVKETYIGA